MRIYLSLILLIAVGAIKSLLTNPGALTNSTYQVKALQATEPLNIIAQDNKSFPFVVDGLLFSNLNGLTPNDIAYMEILNAHQAQIVFGKFYPHGVIFVVSNKKKFSDVNESIQRKIDELYPSAGSYRKQMGRNEEALTSAINFAEKNDWLILINGKESTLDILRNIAPASIQNISYTGEDSSLKYGAKAKYGVVIVQTKI